MLSAIVYRMTSKISAFIIMLHINQILEHIFLHLLHPRKNNIIRFHGHLCGAFVCTLIHKYRDEDPVLAKNRIRGSIPQTKGDFLKSVE
mgnify:CR=1 FL=1